MFTCYPAPDSHHHISPRGDWHVAVEWLWAAEGNFVCHQSASFLALISNLHCPDSISKSSTEQFVRKNRNEQHSNQNSYCNLCITCFDTKHTLICTGRQNLKTIGIILTGKNENEEQILSTNKCLCRHDNWVSSLIFLCLNYVNETPLNQTRLEISCNSWAKAPYLRCKKNGP